VADKWGDERVSYYGCDLPPTDTRRRCPVARGARAARMGGWPAAAAADPGAATPLSCQLLL